jgi:tRNA-dihydrouridine synthase A
MREPLLVGECVAAMKAEVSIPVTVKCRLGVDEQDIEPALDAMADAVFAQGCDALIVHARKAWLKGLSPKDNRTIPPLDYDRVHRLKARLPDKIIAINGGIETIDTCVEELRHVDGVMLGRAAYNNPELLLAVDPVLFGKAAPYPDVFIALEAYESYIAYQLEKGVPLHAITRHILGLFAGRRGSRAFRRHLSTEGVKAGSGLDVLRTAIGLVSREDPAQDAA